jgi:hypothetical protein
MSKVKKSTLLIDNEYSHKEHPSFRIKLKSSEASGLLWVSEVLSVEDNPLAEVRLTRDEIKDKFILDHLPIIDQNQNSFHYEN